MSSVTKRPDGKYRARFRDADGREHAKHFRLKKDANAWLDEVITSVGTGTYVAPDKAKLTVSDWCDQWLAGYSNRPATVRQAQVHVKAIKAGFPGVRVRDVRPSMVKAWVKDLQETKKPSTVYVTYRRFAQIMAAAHRDGLIMRSPCSRETAPSQAKQRTYVASPFQVWALHEAFPEHLRPAILLAAFAGLRLSEVSGLRPQDLELEEPEDWGREHADQPWGPMVRPAVQFRGAELKSDAAATPIPILVALADQLAASMERFPGTTVVTDGMGGPASPWAIERAMRRVRAGVEGLPDGFRFHDLRHFYASTLLYGGLDVKTVQVRVRHASAMTTLNTYGHLMEDADTKTRAVLGSAFGVADKMRTAAALESGQPRSG